MAGFFFNLGKKIRPTMQKSKWVMQSLSGSEEEGIVAEYEMGKEQASLFAAEAPIEVDTSLAMIVNRIGGHLTDRMTNKQRKFTFHVVDLPEPNAFALPGGFIFVTTPLLGMCGLSAENLQVLGDSFSMSKIPGEIRDEIAFVLGHEMAHVLRGHAMERMVNSTVVNTATRAIPVTGMMGRLLLGAGSKAMHSAYSQAQELEADELGARVAAAAGYVPGGAITMLQRLKELSAKSDDGLGDYFATHPPFDIRIEALQKLIK
jgi:beta-barrel assembly-enhancing protease